MSIFVQSYRFVPNIRFWPIALKRAGVNAGVNETLIVSLANAQRAKVRPGLLFLIQGFLYYTRHLRIAGESNSELGPGRPVSLYDRSSSLYSIGDLAVLWLSEKPFSALR